MLTDPIQEDVFREDEFEEKRYRTDLLPSWMKAMAWIGVVPGAIMVIAGFSCVTRHISSPDMKYEKGRQFTNPDH